MSCQKPRNKMQVLRKMSKSMPWICQPESPNVTCTAESRAQISISLTRPAHESEPPQVICTTGLGVTYIYAQVLRSCEGCANNRGSPMSRNHLEWSVRQDCAPNLDPSWACGAGGEHHVKDCAQLWAGALTPEVQVMSSLCISNHYWM